MLQSQQWAAWIDYERNLPQLSADGVRCVCGRYPSPVDQDGDHQNISTQSGRHFEANPILGVIQPAATVLPRASGPGNPASLPEELRPLCQRHACELTDTRWSYDVGELVKDLEKVVRSKLQILRVKDKRLLWLAGGTIILALFLAMAFVWQNVFPKAAQVQNHTSKHRK